MEGTRNTQARSRQAFANGWVMGGRHAPWRNCSRCLAADERGAWQADPTFSCVPLTSKCRGGLELNVVELCIASTKIVPARHRSKEHCR
jgi:hypothetical protein